MAEPATPSRADSEHRSGELAAAVVASAARLDEPRLQRLAALLGALGGALRRLVLVGEGAAELPAGFAPVLRVVGAPPGVDSAAALRAGVEAALEGEPVDALVLVDDRLAHWPLDEVALADAYALDVAVRLGAVAGWLEPGARSASLRPGLVVCAAPAWREGAARLRGGDAREGSPVPVLDLRALARLADLEVPASTVTSPLATGLGRWRDRLARIEPRLDRRFAIDEASFPGALVAGEPLPLTVAGWIARVPQPERLELRVGERRLELVVALPRPDVLARFPDLADDRCGFRFEGTLGGLAPGRHPIAIGLRGRPGARRLGAVRVRRAGGDERAGRSEPPAPAGRSAAERRGALAVERCVAVADAAGAWRLEVEGVLADDPPIDAITLVLDGVERLDVDPRSFEPRPAPPGAPARRGFRIAEPLGGGSGRREVRLVARHGRAEVAGWSGELVVPERAAGLALESEGIERLRRAEPAFVHGALVLEGRVAGAPADARIALELDGREVAASLLDAEARFRLVHELAPGVRVEGECVASARGAELARSGRFAVVARTLAVPAPAVEQLRSVLDALAPLAPALRAIEPRSLLRAALLLRPAERGDLEAALERLAARVAAARADPARVGAALPPAPSRPLRVLFVAWEIPWSGHGGGVFMLNLLRHLGARHEVTLLHPVHPGGEGLSEEARPHVREILTVPRGWRPVVEPAELGVPERLLRTYSPELRAAVAAELGSGRFDLANFEYFGGWLHAPPVARVPDLLAFYESTAFALAAAAPARFADELDAADHLRALLLALRFETDLVPARFPRLVAPTAPEAELLAPFLPGVELALNPIAVDVEGLAARARGTAEPAQPTFVFLGSYRHPPNRDAARMLVEQIAPRLRASLPSARILLAGDRAPVELVEAARRAGVEHLGWVDDPARLLGGATAFLAPITTGAGMRVKHLEAMACGCPVATTALGMSGIAAEPERDYLRGESVEELVAAAVRLAAEPELRRRLAESARALVARDHAPAVQGERRERIWAAAL